MTLLSTQGRSVGERNAIKGWLTDHGAGSGPEIDTTKLEGTGINQAALTKAAAEVPIDLVVLKAATKKGQRADLDEKRIAADARLALRNTAKLCGSVTDELTALTGQGVPSKSALTKLSAKAKALYSATWQWSQGEKHLAWLKPEDHQELRSLGQAVQGAYIGFATELAHSIAAQGKVPGPYAARALEQLRADLLNVGSWATMLVPDEERLAGKQARTLQKIQATLGLPMEEVEQRFHFVLDSSGEPALCSSKPFDLELSSRGLTTFAGGRSWSLHQGNLNFADNLITDAWVLPDLVEGSVSLANNAIRDLQTFYDHSVEITKDLDLSHNKNLRKLDGLEDAKIGGDVNLVGVPAQSLPAGLAIGGKLILDSSQTSLIRAAEHRKIAHQVVDQQGHQPFQIPADPGALLVDPARSTKLSNDELRAVVLAIPAEQHAPLAATLMSRIAGAGLEAKEAFRAVGLLDHELAQQRLATELALIPADPQAPLPPELLALPPWKLRALCRMAASEDLRQHQHDPDHTSHFPLTRLLKTPRADRILEVLLDQARSGQSVSFLEIPLPHGQYGYGALGHLSRDRAAPQKWEILARDLQSVRMEKGELYLKVKSHPAELPAAELFRGFAGRPEAYLAMESVAQRYPKNEAFLSTYRFLLENTFSDSATNRSTAQRTRQALVEEQLLALADPSPALSQAMQKVEQLGRRTTEPEAKAIAAAATKGLRQLGEHERGAVFHAILRQDAAELSRGDSPQARSVMLEVAGQIFRGLSSEQRQAFLEPLIFATVDQLFNQPTEAAPAQARFAAALASVPASLRAYTLFEFKGPLGIGGPGKEALDRGVKELIGALPDVKVATALRNSGWWYSLTPYRAELAAKLATIKVDGELAVQLRPILEHLQLLPGMKG